MLVPQQAKKFLMLLIFWTLIFFFALLYWTNYTDISQYKTHLIGIFTRNIHHTGDIFKSDTICKDQRKKLIGRIKQNGNFTGGTDYHHKNRLAIQNFTKTNISNNNHNKGVYDICPHLTKPDFENAKHRQLQRVNKQAWVFSAYYDHRKPNHRIRVITWSMVDYNESALYCQMWFNYSREPHIQKVALVDVHIHIKKYNSTAKIVSCFLKDNRVPYAVSLVQDGCKPTNVLRVINNYRKDQTPKYMFNVCGPILQNKYDDSRGIIHMIEMNMFFGADHFVFYNWSLGANASAVLKKYQREGIVDVIPWKLPPFKLHYFAQPAALIDCHYSNLYTSKYIVISDMDELIVPRNGRTWSDVMMNLPHKNSSTKPGICAALFRNAFFHTQLKQPKLLNDTEHQISKKYGINTLLMTKRDYNITPYARTKWIGDPTYITMASIHRPQICRPDGNRLFVDLSEGMMHHYRRISLTPNQTTTKDDFMLRYKDDIIKRITKRFKRFNLD